MLSSDGNGEHPSNEGEVAAEADAQLSGDVGENGRSPNMMVKRELDCCRASWSNLAVLAE